MHEAETPKRLDGLSLYLTPDGLKRFQQELQHLTRVERPKVVEVVSWAAGNGDRSENGDYIYGKRRLREIDRRIRFLTQRIRKARVVDPADQARRDRVFFGATVTCVTQEDEERTITIVGVDEADLDRGEVSLASPIARALIGKAVGDEVSVVTPARTDVLEILNIVYPQKDQ